MLVPNPPFRFDWPVRVGNNLPRLFRVPEGTGWANLTGATMHLRIWWAGGEITMRSDEVVKIDGLQHGIWLEDQADTDWRGFFGVRLSLAQTHMLPTDLTPVRYEIERRLEGEESTDFEGRILVRFGEVGDE